MALTMKDAEAIQRLLNLQFSPEQYTALVAPNRLAQSEGYGLGCSLPAVQSRTGNGETTMPLSDKAAASKDANAMVPSMQHRHFAFIAQVVKDAKGMLCRDHHQALAEDFANRLKHSNPAFNRSRFMRACGAE